MTNEEETAYLDYIFNSVSEEHTRRKHKKNKDRFKSKHKFDKIKERLKKEASMQGGKYSIDMYYIRDIVIERHYENVFVPEHIEEKIISYDEYVVYDRELEQYFTRLKPIYGKVVIPSHYRKIYKGATYRNLNPHERLKRRSISNRRKFAKDMTNSKIRQSKFRMNNDDFEEYDDMYIGNGSRYRKAFDYSWEIF